jgi:hypothetical protein
MQFTFPVFLPSAYALGATGMPGLGQQLRSSQRLSIEVACGLAGGIFNFLS